MEDQISLLIGTIAAIAPAFIAMYSQLEKVDKVRDECMTLRETLARKISNENCCNYPIIRDALSSTPCEVLDDIRRSSIRAIAGSFILVVYFLYLAIQMDMMFGYFLGVLVPYTILWGFVKMDLAGILATARGLVTSGCSPHPNREDRGAD